jgi:hypothetical protein
MTQRTETRRPADGRGRDSRTGLWIVLGLIAAIVIAVVLFFALGGDADVDSDGGDIDVEAPQTDVDIDPPEIDAEAPDIDVDPGELDIEEGDAEADADADN